MRAIRLVVFILAVLLAQMIFGYAIFIHTAPEIAKLRTYLHEGNAILYLGDSVVHGFGPTDSNRSTLAEMLAALGPQGSVKDLSHGAYEMRIFDAYVSYIARSGYHPSAIIVPINLRAFTPAKDREPVYQFAKETFILTTRIPFAEYFYRPLAIFRAIDLNPISTDEFLATPLYRDDVLVGHVSDYQRIEPLEAPTVDQVRDFIIFEHMYPLKPDDRNVIALEHLAKTARENDLNVIFYVTPIDYERGNKFVGSEFKETIETDARVLCDIVEKQDFQCLDLSTTLSSSFFLDSALIDVHMKAPGRAFVAQKVYDAFSSNIRN